MGGSAGAAVAALVMAERDVDVRAAVLVSPLLRLRSVVEAMERRFGVGYRWSDRSRAVARRLDFVARADEIATRQRDPAILLVVGEDDDPAGFREPAAEMRDALAQRYADAGRAELALIEGMGHALADEPGVEPSPQSAQAAEVDRRAVRWLRRHLRSG
jgi:pimeloyl-ACP methyl ester carboxylesterase